MPQQTTPITGTRIAARRTNSKRTGLLPVGSTLGDMARFLEAVREQLEVRDAQRGNPLDASPTYKDLIDAGVITSNGVTINGREFTIDQLRNLLTSTVPDWVTSELAPPPAASVVVSLEETSVKVTWVDLATTFTNYAYTEVWRANANNLSVAVRAFTVDAPEMHDVLPPPNTQFYYWVRHVSRSGIVGEFQGVSGVTWGTGMPSAVTILPSPTTHMVNGDILLQWLEPASNVDIKYYVVYELDAQNDPVLPALGRSNTTWFYYTPTVPGTYRFGVIAIPMAGEEPGAPVQEQLVPFSFVVTGFTAPLNFAYQIIGNKIEFSWAAPSNVDDGTTARLTGYEIWHTSIGPAENLVQVVGGVTNKFRIPIDYYSTSRTYFVVATDSVGQRGASASLAVDITLVSAPPSFGVVISGEDLVISWGTPASLMPLSEYEIQYGNPGFTWGTGTALPRISANSIRLHPTWNGSRDFRIKAYDINGNESTEASVNFVIAAPGTPSGFRTDVVDNNVLLYWTPAPLTASQLPVASFEVRKGAVGSTWETAVAVGTKQGSFTTIFEAASGTYRYHIAAKDSAGQYGVSTSTVASVAEPPDYILNASLDEAMNGIVWSFDTAGDAEGWSAANATVAAANGVLTLDATATDPQLTLSTPPTPAGRQYMFGCEWPVLQIRLRRKSGAGSESGTGLARVYYGRVAALDGSGSRGYDAGFRKDSDVTIPSTSDGWKTLTFDMSSLTVGTTDWMLSRITAIRFDIGATSDDDFEIDWIRALPFTSSNMVWDGVEGGLLGPYTNDLTVVQNYALGPWTTPDAKIAAGYDYPLQPSATTGYIEKVIDYGTTLPGIKIASLPVFNVLDGAVAQQCTISISNTDAVSGYTDNVGQSTIFGVNFRWVKIRWDFTAAAGDDTMEVESVNTKTDAKIKNDMGTGTIAVAANGATVTFNASFVDIESIVVTPSGTAARYAVYAFTDVPNPTSFTVYMFDQSGALIGNDIAANVNFSWAARGY